MQTLIRWGLPSTTALTRWMLAIETFLVRLWAWLTCMPTCRSRPQMSHFLDMTVLLSVRPSAGRIGCGRLYDRPSKIKSGIGLTEPVPSRNYAGTLFGGSAGGLRNTQHKHKHSLEERAA